MGKEWRRVRDDKKSAGMADDDAMPTCFDNVQGSMNPHLNRVDPDLCL